MKSIIQKLALAALLLAGTVAASAKNTTAPAPSAEQQAAKLKEKWTKVLNEALRDFQNSNDRESAEFVAKMLQSIENPNGMTTAAREGYAKRMKEQVRNLVHNGAMESASALNWAQWQALYQAGPGLSGPAQSRQQTGGTPGTGGLVLYMPFDEQDKGGVVSDASGSGNDGRVQGATWVNEGKFGGAYQFRITNLTDRIVVPNSDLLNPEAVTVSAWIKTADADGFWNRIVDKDFRNAYCLGLGGDLNGKAGRGKLVFESSRGSIGSDQVLNDGKWHHVAGSSDGKVVRCYIDGVVMSHPVKLPGPLKKSGWDLCIGNSMVDYGTGEFVAFDGLIDEVRIYSRALSAEEVKALATATQAGVEIAGAPKPAASEPTAKPSASERLKQVKALFEQGLISKEDYDKKVKEIMAEL
jgi:hypothetical protein